MTSNVGLTFSVGDTIPHVTITTKQGLVILNIMFSVVIREVPQTWTIKSWV
jgi:hypothetical protein